MSNINKYKKRNLSPTQLKILQSLRNNDSFIVTNSDKNLGPVIMEREKYIKLAFENYVDDYTTYRQLHPKDFFNLLIKTRQAYYSIINKAFKEYNLPLNEIIFLCCILEIKLRKFAQFYHNPKLHKIEDARIEIPSRPIITPTNTLLSHAGKYVNYQLERIISKHVSTYITDSFALCDELMPLKNLPKQALLFTADAISAYTYTDTRYDHLSHIKWMNWLEEHNKLPINYLTKLINT